MKSKKLSTYVILLILVAVTVIGLGMKPDLLLTQLQTMTHNKKQDTVSQPEPTVPNAGFELEAETDQMGSDTSKPASSASSSNASDNTVTTEGLTFTFHQVKVTKQIGSYRKSMMNFWNESIDEAGNLTGSDTYVFIQITIKNESDAIKEEYLNGVCLSAMVNGVPSGGVEMRYFEQGIDPNSKGYFLYKFQPHEESTFDLGYIVEDALLEKYEFCFVINMRGKNPVDETCKIIPVTLK